MPGAYTANEIAVLRAAKTYARIKLLGCQVVDRKVIMVDPKQKDELVRHFRSLLLHEAEQLLRVVDCLEEDGRERR